LFLRLIFQNSVVRNVHKGFVKALHVKPTTQDSECWVTAICHLLGGKPATANKKYQDLISFLTALSSPLN
jgi:hypothetical protein